MYPQERQEEILAILQKNRYVTVAHLMGELHYSAATINRDLNALEERGLVHRSYGGVELVEGTSSIPIPFRQHKQHRVKNAIARVASTLVKEGDVLFIDGSTTAQCMGPYLAEIADVTVITVNLQLALYLSEHGVKCVCLGGEIVEIPSITGGVDAVNTARRYRADTVFFSTSAATQDGLIHCDAYEELFRTMFENSRRRVYLVDGEKLHYRCPRVLCDFGEVDAVISDHDYTPLKERYPNTRFLTAE